MLQFTNFKCVVTLYRYLLKGHIIKNLIFVFLLFLTISAAFSEDSPPVTEKGADNLSSEENRKNLDYQIAIAFIGLEYSTSAPPTFSASYFLNPNSILSLRYTNINKNDEKLRAVALGYKHFLGNSFNIMPTLGWRRTVGIDDNTFPAFVFYSTKFAYEEINAGFRIGNEWQWENFTMGCDWIGLNKTLLKLHSTGDTGIINSAIKKSTTFTLLSFYLGYSF